MLFYKNYNDSWEVAELMEFAGISLLSWIGVIILVLEFEKQIKEMLLFKKKWQYYDLITLPLYCYI